MPASKQAELHQRSMSCAGQSAASMTTSAPAMKSAISASLSSRRAVEVHPHLRVEGAQPRRRRLHLEQADVGLLVEDLAVEVAGLDPVAVDQPHLADPELASHCAAAPPRPPTPNTATFASRSRRWHSEGVSPGVPMSLK